MKQHKLAGLGVALVTPFRDHAIDFSALEQLIEHVIEGGVDYIVSLGTTGEAVTLSAEECRRVFNFTIQQVNDRIPIVAGLFGRNDTAALLERVQSYDLSGFTAIMSSSPSYNKPSQDGVFRHYMALAEVSPLPIIIYNVPGRTGSNVEPETIIRLAEASDRFIAVKEASGNLQQAGHILKYRPDHFLLLSGEDPLTLPMLAMGGDGVISVIANLYPDAFSQMVQAARAGKYDQAAAVHLELLDIHPWLYIEGNPSGVKAGLELKGLCSKEVRLPLAPLSDNHCLSLKKEMDKVRW